MRTTRPASCLVPAAILVLLATCWLAAALPGEALAKASAAYYAALVASARGNTDATNRQLLLLASRWDAALREAQALLPDALKQDPAWGAALQRATGLLREARDRARARDVANAHADLEEMRLVLHEVRERHHLWSFDDHLAQYHEDVERVTGHISGRSEINFTPKDYEDVAEDLRAAQEAWAATVKTAGPLSASAAWQASSRDTASALQEMTRAVAARDRAGVAREGDRLRTAYFALLTAIARSRG